MSQEFKGFGSATTTFLKELKSNNTKEWFDANRDRYQSALVAPARRFVEAIGPALFSLDPNLRVEPRINGSIFRINRDLRFSKDKRPYKEELGFRFPQEGEKGKVSGFLMRIRPDLVGVAAGQWAFDKDSLARFRKSAADRATGPELAGTLQRLTDQGCHLRVDRYKRVPKPWSSDHPQADLLKLKGLIVGQELPIPPEFDGPEFVDWCLAHFKRLAPVHDWLSEM